MPWRQSLESSVAEKLIFETCQSVQVLMLNCVFPIPFFWVSCSGLQPHQTDPWLDSLASQTCCLFVWVLSDLSGSGRIRRFSHTQPEVLTIRRPSQNTFFFFLDTELQIFVDLCVCLCLYCMHLSRGKSAYFDAYLRIVSRGHHL